MKKTVGILILLAWVPFVLAMAFPVISAGMYEISGIMLLLFGTWAGILLVREK